MRTLMLTAGVVATLAMAGGPAGAQPDEHHYYHHHHHYEHSDCRYRTHRRGAIGAVTGAVGGGIIGNSISHGAGGTLLGAGAGALAGNAIGRNTTRC